MKIYLHNRLIETGSGIVTADTPLEHFLVMKQIRIELLSFSDWTQIPDCRLDEDTKRDWREWRQYLRDITTLPVDDFTEEFYELNEPPLVGKPSWWIRAYGVAILPQEIGHEHGPNEEPHSH